MFYLLIYGFNIKKKEKRNKSSITSINPLKLIKGVCQLEILEITLQSHHQLHDAANISQRLVHPAADYDFLKLSYYFQNCVIHLKKKYSFLSP